MTFQIIMEVFGHKLLSMALFIELGRLGLDGKNMNVANLCHWVDYMLVGLSEELRRQQFALDKIWW